jgi:branched-chain amino acid transport system substrate-binding protein
MRFATTAMSGVVAVLLASVAPASAQDTLKIGLVMTLSGQFADAGIQMQNGVKTYMKEHARRSAARRSS